jgi:predicted O-methyltransferase YrrM
MSVLLHLLKWQLGLAAPEVWTTAAERDCLARHAAGKRRLAEVGVWHAGTTKGLRAAMATNGTLFAIDPYERGRLGFSAPRIVARRELAGVRNGCVVWVRKTGADAARSAEILEAVPLDFVFIDNAQTYDTLKVEWEAWTPHVAPGGVIALHDTQRTPGEAGEQTSVSYAREVVARDPRFEVVDTADSLTVLRRLNS